MYVYMYMILSTGTCTYACACTHLIVIHLVVSLIIQPVTSLELYNVLENPQHTVYVIYNLLMALLIY